MSMNEHYIFQKHPMLTIGDISALIYNSSESAIYSKRKGSESRSIFLSSTSHFPPKALSN